jgi:hypothetical protein
VYKRPVTLNNDLFAIFRLLTYLAKPLAVLKQGAFCGLPFASSAIHPYIRSAPMFQYKTTPSKS